MTRRPQQERWSASQGGCLESRDWLIEHHLPLVDLTVTRVVPRIPVCIDVEDLRSQGMIGLVEAVDRFDPERGVKFTSYAIAKIRGKVLDWLRTEDWVPRSVRRKQKWLRAAEDTLLAQGRAVSARAMADYLELDVDELQRLEGEAQVRQLISWDDVVSSGGWDDPDPLYLQDAVADPRPGPELRALENEANEQVEAALGGLRPADRQVIRRYYWQGETLKSIAKANNRSESRAHQLHHACLARLREQLAA